MPLSSRRDRLSTIDLIRTYDDSNSDFPEYLADQFPRQPTPTYPASARDRSDSPKPSSKAVHTRVKALEAENRGLQETIRDMEETAKAEREVWKRRLLAEVSVSRNRELDLLSRFNSIERKLNIEEKRIKDAETVYKNSEAALLVRLEQANADCSTLESRLRKVESDYDDVYREKSALQQLCERKDDDIAECKRELTAMADELKAAYAELRGVQAESGSFGGSEQGRVLERLEVSKGAVNGLHRESIGSSEPFIIKYLHETSSSKEGPVRKCSIKRLKSPTVGLKPSLSIQSDSPKLSTVSSPRLSVEKLDDR